MLLVQGLRIGIEGLAFGVELFRVFGLVGRRQKGRDVQRLGKLGEYVGLAGLVGMELEAEGPEPDFRQACVDDVKCGLLLGNEEDATAVCEIVGDQVRDRLRLAGAGRTVQDEGLAELGVEDGRQLRRVGAQGTVEVHRIEMLRDLLRWEDLDAVVKDSVTGDEMADERILLQDIEPGGEVLPHHELAERELSERDVAGHAPAVHFRHGLGKGVEDLREIDAVVVFGNGIESLDGDVELGAQELDQRGVDRRVLVGAGEPEVGERLAHERHRQEDERGAVGLGILRGGLPVEKANREEERVDARFLQIGLGEAKEVLEALLRLRFRAGRDQQVVHGIGEGDRHFGVAGELVLKPGDIAARERQHALRVADVQEPVPQGQVQQFLRPPGDARGQGVFAHRGVFYQKSVQRGAESFLAPLSRKIRDKGA